MAAHQSAADLEKGAAKAQGRPNLYGFASVADLVVQDPSRAPAIYRRYDRLAARNLLYHEARLAVLEEKQMTKDIEDGLGDDYELKTSARSWEQFVKYAKNPGKHSERMQLAKEIEETLRKYYEALRLNYEILSLPEPEKHVLQGCKKMFQRGGIDTLQGVAGCRLDDPTDLCALRESKEKDLVSKYLMNWFPVFFMTKSTDTDGVIFTSHKRLRRWVAFLATTAAFGLLFGGIEALYGEQSHQKRLGTLAGFVLGFAVCVRCFTDAKNTDVFAATAAYAAVLVVYVSGEERLKTPGTSASG